MNSDVGNDSGCFDIAPYETRCASFPIRRAMSEVSLPPVLPNPFSPHTEV